MPFKIAIGGDHAGFHLKEIVKEYLISTGNEVKDFGTYSDESCDYPDFAHSLSDSIEKGEFEKGILVCGSGMGVCMTANKHQKIRAALCYTVELAKLARSHNNANILCLGGRLIAKDLAISIVDAFLMTDFEGGRHQRRVNKIPL